MSDPEQGSGVDTYPWPATMEDRGRAKKRRDIIDGARRVFFDKGFDAASMDAIARAASVSKATIYVYFPSKADLFCALVEVERKTVFSLPSVCSSLTLAIQIWNASCFVSGSRS